MTFKALVYAYVLGGITFIPLVVFALVFFTIYTSVPVGDIDVSKNARRELQDKAAAAQHEHDDDPLSSPEVREGSEKDGKEIDEPEIPLNDRPRTRKGWLTMRRTFEESAFDGGYVTLVRSFLDARSKDPKRSRPKDMWYVVLKGSVLYLYEDEGMTECEAALELGRHEVVVYPEGLPDGELFAKRNAICLKPRTGDGKVLPSVRRETKLDATDEDRPTDDDKAREEAPNTAAPWFIFVRSNVEMEDWYFAFVHASEQPAHMPTLAPLSSVFRPADMYRLVQTLDAQPDVIPMRWLNALIGRIFFSCYRTHALEANIVARLMRKLAKVKRPAFLTDIVVTEVSVGNTAPTLSKPMLKELTQEGDAALEVKLQYKGEVRITVQATATINLGARFKPYVVKLTLAAVLREIEGNLLIKVKRPPSNRIWYAFTQTPKMVLDVEPVVSDRQITWSMILNTIESRLKEIIQESVVMPNMDDISFFETSSYAHRGGIWPEASRREKTRLPEDSEPASEETPTPASAPTLDGSEPSASTLPEPDVAELQPPQSTEETLSNAPTISSASAEAEPVVRSGVDVPPPGSLSPRVHARRMSWFSSVSKSTPAPLEEDPQEEQLRTVDEPRGRMAETDSSNSTGTTPRSRSTPSSYTAGPERPESASSSKEFLSPPNSDHPSTSWSPSDQAFPSVDNSATSSTFSESSSPPTLHPGVKSSQRSISTGANSTPPGSPSFLSTLKSRAGDKQALGNTAKEAMRKWGVNWGGLKRDGSSGSAPGREGSAGSSQDASTSTPQDEQPDVGHIDRRERVDSQRTRQSYADVRAAVAERKERERASHVSSDPITIPEGGKGKGRSISMGTSSTSFSGGLSASSSSSSSKGTSGDPTPSPQPKFVSPSMSRTTTELHMLDAGPPAIVDPPSPIHTQPMQARTMTIPGIHASHRGEVMSMGYVAPTPPPSVSDNKLKSPGIQSVYRLWKSPHITGQPQQEAQEAQGGKEEDRDVPPLPMPPSHSDAPSSVRAGPPPLPPRSIDPSSALSRPETPKRSSVSSSTMSSPASEALKTIATKDRRISAEFNGSSITGRPALAETINSGGLDNYDDGVSSSSSPPSAPVTPSKPPLPPRRIQASG
ncbi:hypothetical protein PLICRDRAFT_50021 [Plicaturopsis crispa FD-325 SS-3]|nr:hypothetical protein PLICRDRAFT_50021 [Plicaturopsis crispa FD-325 SS-3]